MCKTYKGIPEINQGIIAKNTELYRVFNRNYEAVNYPPIDFDSMWRFSPLSLPVDGDVQGFYVGDSVRPVYKNL